MSVAIAVNGRQNITNGLQNTPDDDIFDGTEGATVSNASLTAAVTINLNLTDEQDTRGGGNDLFSGIDHLIGTDYNDTLTGNDNDNTLTGGEGNDILRGGLGNDTLQGESEDDTIFGESENDTLSGGSGYDTLNGGSGVDTLDGGSEADVLIGGIGRDNLTGGSGADQFKFIKPNEGGDTITDFRSSDKLVFVSANFGRLAVGALSSTLFRANTQGATTSTSQRFVFNTRTSELRYDADGTGSVPAVTIATLTGVTRLSANQIQIVAS
ncbi:MAG: hypothetical protein HQL91_10275 [Magnetococcales bacterium]|nr:hypothetical protein [Magnetococcales bacterium]